jgi:periplasmic protein TonB
VIPLNNIDTDLTAAALEAVRQWRYKPTLLNGMPVEVLTEIDVEFN